MRFIFPLYLNLIIPKRSSNPVHAKDLYSHVFKIFAMFDILKTEALKAVKLIEKYDFIRIYTHNDADGITAGAIISRALLRIDKRYHLSFLRGLNESIEYSSDELLILEDMGSGYPDIISNIDADVIIIDHHYPIGRIEAKRECVHINPHLAGLDGTYELSASGTAYVLANMLGNNKDLAGIALIGALGDKQKITGGNAEILREGIRNGFIEIMDGLNIHSGKIRDVLVFSIEPFLDFYKKDDELDEFLSRIGIDGDKDLDDLTRDELHRLSNAIVLRLLKMGAYEGAIKDFVGRRIVLKNELIKSITMFTDVVNACGRISSCSIGFALCMRDGRYLERALDIWRRYTVDLLEEIHRRREDIREGFCIRYLIMENAQTTGPIATVFSRYLYPDKPFVAVNIKNEKAKVSARGNDKIKIDLAEVMRKAAEKVGGRGGGHRVAAGANISSEKVEEFIKEVDRLCCMAR